jgi:hypothetical protein
MYVCACARVCRCLYMRLCASMCTCVCVCVSVCVSHTLQTQKVTLLMVTHNPDVECYADRVLYIQAIPPLSFFLFLVSFLRPPRSCDRVLYTCRPPFFSFFCLAPPHPPTGQPHRIFLSFCFSALSAPDFPNASLVQGGKSMPERHA